MRSWLSTPSPRPPQLDVELEQTHLQRLLEPLVAVDGRTELTVGDDGLVATSVDEAMTTSVEAALHQSLCHDYEEAAPGSIVIDAAALLDAVDGERDDDSLPTHIHPRWFNADAIASLVRSYSNSRYRRHHRASGYR